MVDIYIKVRVLIEARAQGKRRSDREYSKPDG